MKAMKIGFDFDGVIANTARKKMEISAQKYGVYVDIKNYNHKGFIDAGMSEKQYESLNRDVYSEYDIRPVQGCLTYLRKIIEDGHNTLIRSYRKINPGDKIMKNFLINHGLIIEDYMCTDNKPKSRFCSNLDFFIDDRVYHLIELKNSAKNLFLFDAPYNRDEKLTNGILRVKGWSNLYSLVRKISNCQ